MRMHDARAPGRAPLLRAAFIGTLLATGVQVPHARAEAALGDKQVRKLVNLALDHIGSGLCEQNKRCAPASAEERINPPITIAEARLVIHRGVLSGAAEHCGLDWQGRNFMPMMSHWRHKMKKNERQMALIGMLHGIMKGIGRPDAKLACTAHMRETVDRQLAFRP
ncbi:MAG: hypothetical protein IT536_12325 [Hyphomicrobiales bacterium]|nr:hypothetical protein [Hyphomicrobiales bacterium]